MSNTALARKWDFYEDDEDLDEDPSGSPALDYPQTEEEYESPEYEEAEANVLHPPQPLYGPIAYSSSFTRSNSLPVPAYQGWEWHDRSNAQSDIEAVYAYGYYEALPGRRPRLSLGDQLATLFRNRLVVVGLMLVVGWLAISNGLNWLNSLGRSAAEDMYSFAGTGGVVVSLDGKTSSSEPAPVAPTPGQMSVEGKPSISVAKIEQVLKQYNSPAVGTGQFMYDTGIKYNIDPAFALAFFVHESTAGTKGVATVTKSIGNIRQTANSGFDGYQGFRKYPSWEAGVEDWYKLIRNLYINGWGLRTVEGIIPKYAPAADRNNPPAYINQVRTLVEGWRSGK